MRDFNESDDEEVMTECSAALLLMKLSCSPHSPAFYGSSSSSAVSSMHQKQLPSPVASSSGASSFRYEADKIPFKLFFCRKTHFEIDAVLHHYRK